jgi:prevent-host-death family protein
MDTLSAREAKANLHQLIDQVAFTHQPILITGKRADAVLLSSQDWTSIQETLYLLSVPGMRDSLKRGMAEPLENSAKKPGW